MKYSMSKKHLPFNSVMLSLSLPMAVVPDLHTFLIPSVTAGSREMVIKVGLMSCDMSFTKFGACVLEFT